MRFKGLDLNLLVALDVLLERQNVTRAAEQLNISQPAISAALRRLREHFGDPLLVAYGKRMVPTAYALRLRTPLKSVLSDLNALVTLPAQFDPATSQRMFHMMASDFVLSAVLGDLLPVLEQTAPGIRFTATQPNEEAIALIEAGDLDLFISPPQYLSPNHPTELFFEEVHVVAGWKDNPLMAAPVDRSVLTRETFISAQIGRFHQSFAETELARQGIHLSVALSIPYFAVVPELLVGTSRLAVMHEKLARRAARHLPIAWQPLPVTIPAMQESLQYHRSRSDDPGLRWLIDKLRGSESTVEKSGNVFNGATTDPRSDPRPFS